jgi:hypothetical protein
MAERYSFPGADWSGAFGVFALAKLKGEGQSIGVDDGAGPELPREPQPGDDRFPTDDEFEFSSGKRIYCNGRMFGLSPDMSVGYGADGGYGREDMTPHERIELAQYMIGLWQQYLAEQENGDGR